jgi:hypothetical protein
MSALLEQAIVDASALKEAALKNAESAILDKYAPEIKEAVASLLEQDEGFLGDGPAIVNNISLAAAEEAPLCPCPEEGEEIEIDFDQLQKMADELAEGEPESDEMLAAEFGAEGEEEEEDIFALQEGFNITQAILEALESDEEIELESVSHAQYDKAKPGRRHKKASGKRIEEDDDGVSKLEEEQSDCLKDYKNGSLTWDEYQDCLDRFDEGMSAGEQIELTEENLDAILEELIVDIHPQKSGWAGTPETISNHYTELKLAQMASTEAQEEIKIMKQALGNIKKDYAQMSENLKAAKSKNKKLVTTLSSMKSKLEEVNLSNARLFYTNRVLNSSSLNERQKSKIAEAISDSRSVNEAKVIYETLQNAVGSSRKSRPKSLSEAVNRTSPMMARRESSSSADTSAVKRMQRLAGISNKHTKEDY